MKRMDLYRRSFEERGVLAKVRQLTVLTPDSMRAWVAAASVAPVVITSSINIRCSTGRFPLVTYLPVAAWSRSCLVAFWLCGGSQRMALRKSLNGSLRVRAICRARMLGKSKPLFNLRLKCRGTKVTAEAFGAKFCLNCNNESQFCAKRASPFALVSSEENLAFLIAVWIAPWYSNNDWTSPAVFSQVWMDIWQSSQNVFCESSSHTMQRDGKSNSNNKLRLMPMPERDLLRFSAIWSLDASFILPEPVPVATFLRGNYEINHCFNCPFKSLWVFTSHAW